MNKEQLEKELFWEIRKLQPQVYREQILDLLKKAYDLGYKDGWSGYDD